MTQTRFAFCASTGRTATMFLAATLDALPGVAGLHEGHAPGSPPTPRLPLINLHNRRAWYDPAYAAELVAKLRDAATLSSAAAGAGLLVDAAFYNAPLLAPLAAEHPDAPLLVVFRRCEGFVRSATIMDGEDRQPAGWPDRGKPLTDRERFIALGRLMPRPGTADADRWSAWSAVQRNVWLWSTVNSHLYAVAASCANSRQLFYEDLVNDTRSFWTGCLEPLGLLSEANLENCVRRSAGKINARTGYQLGPAGTWSPAERAVYEELARPLEEQLYG